MATIERTDVAPTTTAEARAVGAGRGWSLAAVALVVAAAVAGLLPGGILAPLAVALLVGLPHGGVDHLTLMRRVRGLPGVALGTVGYLAAAVATFVAMRAVPLPAWALFLAVSVWHFGTADRTTLGTCDRRPSAVHALAVGAVPVGGLMVGDPASLEPLAMALDPAVASLLRPGVVTGVAAGLAVLVVAAAVVEWRAGRTAAVVDLIALVALFGLVPPLWAFGAYFGLWHSLRHVVRMVATESPWRDVGRTRGPAAAWWAFARDAALTTGAAATGMVVLVALAPRLDPAALTAVALQVTAAVTLPHVATVALLDRTAGPSTT